MTKQTKKARRLLARKLVQLRKKSKKTVMVPLLAAALLSLPVVSHAQTPTMVHEAYKKTMTEEQRKAYEKQQADEQSVLLTIARWVFGF